MAALAAAGTLVLTACGGGDGDNDKNNSPEASSGTQLYFVDGNTADYSKDFDKGTLEGVRATYPGAELKDDFKQRLLGINPKLTEFTYGPESYDATVVVALAAAAAKNDSGKAIAQKMQEVTVGGEKCTTYKDCLEMINKGTDIDYDGVSGPIDFNSTGSPSAATIGIFQYQADNTFEPMDYVTGKIPDVDSVADNQKVTGPVPKGDGTLTIGSLLPQSGDLAFLGPPEFAGVDLAVKEINAAGGALGKPVKHIKADSGDGTPNIAPSETDQLLSGGADAIVGAASSSVSLSVIDRIVNAGVVEISPANTSTAFDTYADKGLYFRTAPSDVLQGTVLAQTVKGDGYQNVAILARQEAYGEALAKQVRKVFEEEGGKVVSYQLYDPNAANFTAEVDAIKSQDPDAIVVIAFDETKKIIPALIKVGMGQKH
ncbi:MAG TPA: ABC transporter substrate-binding protein [Marmoricola sp.]|nr:ABC transporter substrate-binding protein [Marmoricola sp.]